MRYKYFGAGLVVFCVAVSCTNNSASAQTSATPQQPRQCSDVLAKEPPPPLKFDPAFAAQLGKVMNQDPDQVVASANRVRKLFYTADKKSCEDPRCGTIVSSSGTLARNPVEQQPFVVVCRNETGTETRFSYRPDDLDPGP
jgi:hypothetical protein